MSKEMIHTCDKCGKRILDEEEHSQAVITHYPRRQGGTDPFDFCAACTVLVEEFFRAAIVDVLERELEGDEDEEEQSNVTPIGKRGED